MAKGTGTYDDPILVDGLFTKTINGVKKFFKIKTGSSVDTSQFVRKSGDTLTGSSFARNVDNDSLMISGGQGWFKGASLTLGGKDYSTLPSGFRLDAVSFDGPPENFIGPFSRLEGKIDGSLTWGNCEVERVNSKGNNYIRYSSGLTFMWGLFGADAGIKRKTVNLPIPFNSKYAVFLSNQGNNNDYGSLLGYQVVLTSLSTFSIQHTWDSDTGWYYLAVGY